MSGGGLHLAIVAGEESGDRLAADLVRAIRASGRDVRLTGAGGRHLAEEGLVSLFDPAEIAVTGIVPVIRRLPRLLHLIGRTARAIAAAKPDLLVIVDNPDFTHRVARKVRASMPGLPIVDYVCPSVWAWRPGRAPAMRAYVDAVLCLLPFEPEALARLGGPSGTYVGHRLLADPHMQAAQAAQEARQSARTTPRTILALPGSRNGEIAALAPVFGQALGELEARTGAFDLIVPTLPRLAPMVAEATGRWPVRPRIVTDDLEKFAAFGRADAALAASGTVLLELALAGVPSVSCYRVDLLVRLMSSRLTLWSAALPNIIADRVVVPEYYNEMMRPGLLARKLEGLSDDGPERDAALDGARRVRERMRTDRPAGEVAAELVLSMLR